MVDLFQVHVFGDSGMEMMPECNGRMCYKHCEKYMFLNGFTFSTNSLIWCLEGGIWMTFWCLLVTLDVLFLIFKGPGDRLEIR